MPVAVKLSKTFYDRFGHEAADELVGVLNQVDAASQNSLREINELNFARFDAKLEQRAAGLEAKIEQQATELEAKIEQRIGELRVELKGELAELRADLKVLRAEISEQMANLATQLRDQQVVHMRWMIGMWIVAVIGIWLKR